MKKLLNFIHNLNTLLKIAFSTIRWQRESPVLNESVRKQALMDIKPDTTHSGGNFKIFIKNEKQQIIFMGKMILSLGLTLK